MPSVNNDERYNDNKFIRGRLRKLFEMAQEQTGNQNLVDKCKKMYQKCVSIFHSSIQNSCYC